MDFPQPVRMGSSRYGAIMMLWSLNMILLTFFIMLNTISGAAQEKSRLVLEGMKGGFDNRGYGERIGNDNAAADFPPWRDSLDNGVRGIMSNRYRLLADGATDAQIFKIRFADKVLFGDDPAAGLSEPGKGVVADLLALAGTSRKPLFQVGILVSVPSQLAAGMDPSALVRMAAVVDYVAGLDGVVKPDVGLLLMDKAGKDAHPYDVVMEFRPVVMKEGGHNVEDGQRVNTNRMMNEVLPTGAKITGEAVGGTR